MEFSYSDCAKKIMANPWFRLYAEFANDPKVQLLSEINQRRLIMIFCFRCNGHVTLHDNEVTLLLRISGEEWQQTKAIFMEKNFIDNNNSVLNWDKRQFISDSSAERVARHRNNKKRYSNVSVTAPDTDTDTEKTKDIAPQALLVSLGVDKNLASDWLKIRRTKKLAITKTCLTRIKQEADKLGWDMNRTIEKCCQESWAGFKASWITKETGRPTGVVL